jgi:hypothetical protein
MGKRGTTDACFKVWGQRLSLFLAVPSMLVLFGAGIYAIGDAVLAPAPTPDHPGFVDTILGSRAVVAAIRLAVIFAGTFVVVSVVAHRSRPVADESGAGAGFRANSNRGRREPAVRKLACASRRKDR